MPWKMIFFLFILLILVVFIAINVDNSSDINFGFRSFTDVPIFVSLFLAFTAGVLVTIPMVLLSGRKKDPNKRNTREKSPKGKQKKGTEDVPAEDDTPPAS